MTVLDETDYEMRDTPKKPLLGNHQKCWIWGEHAVNSTIEAKKWKPYQVVVSKPITDQLKKWAAQYQLDLRHDTDANLTKLCRHEDHQGIIAQMPPFPYTPFSELKPKKTGRTVYIYLDCIHDPHNLGAIVRSAEVLGVTAVLIPSEKSVGVTNLVVRSSVGAVNTIPIVRIDNPATQLAELVEQGFKGFGLDVAAKKELSATKFPDKTILFMGNEADGLTPVTKKFIHEKLFINVHGQIDSLNVSVAAAIAMYEAMKPD
jgi:23S rRNA (guanosine2251-2'-O)-methyltransferase